MVKICAISDLHGYLLDIPECDILIIAGDVCPYYNHDILFQAKWLDTDFRYWLEKIHAKKIIGILGNHDFIGEQRPDLVPVDLNWFYLRDTTVECNGLKFYGCPYSLKFGNWAFMCDEKQLKQKYRHLQERDIDVLISHGPPYGILDVVYRDTNEEECPILEHTGSKALTEAIYRIKPKLVFTGHIHGSYGKLGISWNNHNEKYKRTDIYNCSILDDNYKLRNKPWLIEL